MEKTEEQFLEQLQLFRVLMDNIPDPVYYKDINGVYLGYNKAFQDLLGIGYKNYVGKTVFDLPIGREEVMLHHEVDMELIQSPGSRTYEASMTYPEGSIRYTIAKKATFFKSDGTVGGIVGVVTDITELKKTQEALKESEARFKDLSEASLETVVFIEGGIIIDANRRAHEMFGYDDNDKIIGRNVLDFITPEAHNVVKERMASQDEEKYETL